MQVPVDFVSHHRSSACSDVSATTLEDLKVLDTRVVDVAAEIRKGQADLRLVAARQGTNMTDIRTITAETSTSMADLRTDTAGIRQILHSSQTGTIRVVRFPIGSHHY